MCQLNPELTVFFTGSSLWHSALIAFHRYIFICRKDAYNRMPNMAYIVFVLVVTRVVPALCVFPGLSYSLEASYYKPSMLRCILRPTQGSRIVAISCVLMIFPCAVVVVCYTGIMIFVWRLTRHVTNPDWRLRREMQIVRMFIVNFLVILLGFLPYAILRNFDSDNSAPADVYVIVTVVYAIATCSNPLVYGAMSTDIRRACATFAQQHLPAPLACKCLTTPPPAESDAPVAPSSGDSANSSRPLLRSRPTVLVRTCCGLRRVSSSECVELGASEATKSSRLSQNKTTSNAAATSSSLPTDNDAVVV